MPVGKTVITVPRAGTSTLMTRIAAFLCSMTP
jgi:hypothetical protein